MSEKSLLTAIQQLQKSIEGDVLSDPFSLGMYATDASIYQVRPTVIVLPKTDKDIDAALRIARAYQIPVTARGGGTGLAGQAIGKDMILDFSKYMHHILEINPEEKWARVQPGVVLDVLNRALKDHGLIFAPDPATSSRANIGGMIANNASGTKSILYGKTIDHLLALRVLLADGTELYLRNLTGEEVEDKCAMPGREGEIYRRVIDLVTTNKDVILSRFPKTMRRVSGYPLDAFVESDNMNLSKLFCGSEGTLGILLEAKLNLVPLPKHKGVCVVHFKSLREAIEAVQHMLPFNPAAIEVLNSSVIDYSRKSLATRARCGFLEGEPDAIQIVEFYGDTMADIQQRAQSMAQALTEMALGYAYPFFPEGPGPEYADVWYIRKSGLGLLMGEPGDKKAIALIEDAAVPIPVLPKYIDEVLDYCHALGVECAAYAHASVGVIHLRPVLDLREAGDIEKMKKIQRYAFERTRNYKGSFSSEHGDGLVRSHLIREFFGAQLYRAFEEVKSLFDPLNLMNPGKIIDAQEVDENLRYGPDYADRQVSTFYRYTDQKDFHTAVHQCTGIGACRKLTSGTMCPSYMVTRDEEQSPRGRSNALRLVMSGQLGGNGLAEPRLKQTLDLCISCKACKAECPSSVDVARFKSEVLQNHYDAHGIPVLDRLVRDSAGMAKIFSGPLAPLINGVQSTGLFKNTVQGWMGIHRTRALPTYARQTTASWYKQWRAKKQFSGGPPVILFADTYMNYHQSDIGINAVKVLDALGYDVLLAEAGCCQRPRISHGFLKDAARDGLKTMQRLDKMGKQDVPVVVCEPSCASALTDDLPDLIADAALGQRIGARAMPIETLVANALKENHNHGLKLNAENYLLHGHCHQKALYGTSAIHEIIIALGGQISEVDSGCCGMAGSFGYEKQHFDISRKMAERALLPAVREADADTMVLASGFSCRHQIQDFGRITPYHWIEVIRTNAGV